MEKKMRKYINKKFFLYPKTNEIIEVREELYSIMLDKYNDCLKMGMSEDESYKKAIAMMVDYKEAIREVETGSSLSALKKNLISTALITSFYFITLTLIYLFVSIVVLKTFENTWLIAVGGTFAYLVCFSIKAYGYAKLFNFKILTRCGIAFIYLSLIPILYVFPSLYLSVMYLKNEWNHSWLIVIIIVLFYIMTDYIANRKHISKLERGLHLFISGFILTTILYLSASLWFHLWSIAWILYVAYLAIVSLLFYIGEKMGKFIN
ncbi:MAG: hypothetical protein Q8882_06385 [Bacillota bacterium]|nr:hypothetical protein [Bacillota bacterium]